jgi:hypothetical protein
MSESSGSSGDQERGEREPQKQVEKVKADNEKQIEKVKADNEKQIEKVKADNEKFEEKFLKGEIEKPPKQEVKEKNDFKESKNEIKEHKGEKEFKHEKFEKIEHKGELKEDLKNEIEKLKREKELVKEGGKSEFEKPPASEGPVIPEESTLPIDREGLAQHADALEDAARRLRHFIDQSERPDLSRGALRNEPDEPERDD